MDEFAKLPGGERRVYFEQTAARLGLSAQMIEKDFWVCWTLKRLFSLADFQGHLTFKGGTSLSKVYHVIERFAASLPHLHVSYAMADCRQWTEHRNAVLGL